MVVISYLAYFLLMAIFVLFFKNLNILPFYEAAILKSGFCSEMRDKKDPLPNAKMLKRFYFGKRGN